MSALKLHSGGMSPTTRLSVSPLSLAAYITWAAVSYAVWHDAGAWTGLKGTPARAIAAVLLLIFLASNLMLNQLTKAPSELHRRSLAAALAIQVTATFCLFGMGSQSTSPVLLIIIAAEFMLSLESRVAWMLLICLNAAFYAVLVVVWKAENPFYVLSLYGGFQAFAALTAGSMKKAQTIAENLRLANAELLTTRALLAESARDGERLRVSRELHDVAGHKLTALSLNLELLRKESRSPPRELNFAFELSQEILSDIRAVVSNLRHHDGIDLQEALTRLISMFPTPEVSLQLQQGLRVSGTERAEALLRCAQEALTNAARHADAAHAYVSLTEDAQHVVLSIEDDGRFEGSLELGNGLTGLKERIESVHGSILIDRGPYGGCRIVARIPRHDPA
jgi:signal transduction histidine kinase